MSIKLEILKNEGILMKCQSGSSLIPITADTARAE